MELAQPLAVFWRPVFEITVFWIAYYLFFTYIKDSGMVQALKGLALLFIFFVVAQVFEFKTIRWVLAHLFQISILGFFIIFQPELRRGLTRIGQSPLFRLFLKGEQPAEEIVRAVVAMAKNKVGALIAIEKEVSLKAYAETGIALDGLLSSELLLTTFMPNTPFHDGGVIIQGARVMAVACVFPLSESQKLSRVFGTRHRAGVGLSEETDALVIVVSEETGIISLVTQGKITRDIEEEKLRQHLVELYQPKKSQGARRFRFGRKTQ